MYSTTSLAPCDVNRYFENKCFVFPRILVLSFWQMVHSLSDPLSWPAQIFNRPYLDRFASLNTETSPHNVNKPSVMPEFGWS